MFFFSRHCQIVYQSCHCCTDSPEYTFILLNLSHHFSLLCSIIILLIYISVLMCFSAFSYICHIFIHNSYKYSFSFKETLFNLLVHLVWVVFSLLIWSVLCSLDMIFCWLYLVKYVSPSTSHPLFTFCASCCKLILSFTANLTISVFLWHMHCTEWSYII